MVIQSYLMFDQQRIKFLKFINKYPKTSIFVFIVVINLLPLVYLWLYLRLSYSFANSSIEFLSAVGNYLSGTLGILISFLALVAIVFTFLAQKTQIKIQQSELQNNRNSNLIINFENNFYHLLDFHHKLSNDLDTGIESKNISVGKSGINLNVHNVSDLLQKIETTLISSVAIGGTSYDDAYKTLTIVYGKILGNYFRNLFNILKLIYTSEFLPDRKLYSNIVRAQISDEELLLLFFNSISSISLYDEKNDYKSPRFINFKILIEYFSFFKHLDSSIFIKNEQIDDALTLYLLKFDINAYRGNNKVENYFIWKKKI
ncbi:hypothetical protein BH10BAC5_BH10BAC5_22160 [soil metagenome]